MSAAVRAGYKQTEVGVIPEDWKVTLLANVIDPNRRITYGIVVPGPFVRSGTPMIRAQDYSKGWVDIGALYCVSQSINHAYRRSVVQAGDVLLTIVGSVGNIAKVPREFDGANITQQTARLGFNKSVADADFYFNVLISDFGRRELSNFTKSGVQPSLNLSDVDKFQLPLPPLPEQRAIATALSDVDALLAKLDALIAKKRDLKVATMQQLLTGQTRLPGFSGEWEVKRLGDLLRFQVGFPFGSEFFNQEGDGVRLVKNRDLKADDQIFFYSGKFDDAFVVRVGDVLIGMDGDFLPCLWSKGVALLNQRVGRIVPSAKISALFSYFMLADPLKAIENATSATTVKHLSHGDVEGIECKLPAIEEQTAIAQVLSDMDAELTALEARRDNTRALKQGMMQELLTGRIRLI